MGQKEGEQLQCHGSTTINVPHPVHPRDILPFQQFLASAHGVFNGQHGDISRSARRRAVRRQTLYRQAVAPAPDTEPGRAQRDDLPPQLARARQQLQDLQHQQRQAAAWSAELAALPGEAGVKQLLVRAEGLRRQPELTPGEGAGPAALRGVLLAAAALLSLGGEPVQRLLALVLATFQVEATLPFPAELNRLDRMALGSGSTGPLLLVGAGNLPLWRALLLDLPTLKPLPWAIPKPKDYVLPTENVRAAAGGGLFTLWNNAGDSRGFLTVGAAGVPVQGSTVVPIK